MIVLQLTAPEQQLLRSLLEQYDEIVQSADDPAHDRLFPVAYRDDPDAAAEFARYTRSGLVDHKSSGSGLVAASLVENQPVVLDTESAERWLPVLTDLRLILANRAGILTDDDDFPEGSVAGDIYHWLAALQSELIDALEGDE